MTSKQAKADHLKKEGNELYVNGRYQEAIQKYTAAISAAGGPGTDPDSNVHLLYSNRAQANLRLCRYLPALEDAKKGLKLAPASPKLHARKGRALMGLDKLEEAEKVFKKGINLCRAQEDPADPASKDLAALQAGLSESQKRLRANKAEALSVNSYILTDDWKELRPHIVNGDVDMDGPIPIIGADVDVRGGLLHGAVSYADVPFAREAIKLGCALDKPATQVMRFTALQYAAFLSGTEMLMGRMIQSMAEKMAHNRSHRVRIMRLLLEHGASTEARTPDNGNCSAMEHVLRRSTVLHLAASAGDLGAIKVLLEFGADPTVRDGSGKTPADYIRKHGRSMSEEFKELVQLHRIDPKDRPPRLCRCMSGLPETACHNGGFLPDKRDNGAPLYRYSPCAPCPCWSLKEHYDCCWKKKAKYMSEKTGEISTVNMVTDPETVKAMEEVAEHWTRLGITKMYPKIVNGMPTNEPMSREEWWERLAPVMRMEGCSETCIAVATDCDFIWKKDHYQLDKVELLKRVEEWNAALGKYLDRQGLSEAERERVWAEESASPFAPCGNPVCQKVENKVKEYRLCSRCRLTAYCGKECSAAHWKTGHKELCHPYPDTSTSQQ